jgi:hypothetical protein
VAGGTYRQAEYTFGLVADALGKDEPDGLPPAAPHGTSDCADPEASWGHRKNNLLRSRDDLYWGYYLSAGIMVREENRPAVPELAAAPPCRRAATTRSARSPPY